MAIILNIETGTNICSAALSQDGRLLSLRESSEGYEHARNLAPFIDELLKENDIRAEELDAVAVSKGPGSYTGLRIGTSTAKGLCYALGIPLIAVGSPESLAYVAGEDYGVGMPDIEDWGKALLCPMIDARRMEVYAQVFDTSINPLNEVNAYIVDESSFSEFTGKVDEFLIFGDGAAKCAEVMRGDSVKLIDIVPSARGLITPAFKTFEAGRFEDVAYFEPFYLKDFVVTTSKRKL